MTSNDPVWDTAWDWVIRQHGEALTPSCHAELAIWLATDCRHQQAYDDACELWEATALINCMPS